jgi:hypothetical protein
LSGGAEKLVGANDAGSEEDHGERAEEFDQQFLGEAVHAVLLWKISAVGLVRDSFGRARFY